MMSFLCLTHSYWKQLWILCDDTETVRCLGGGGVGGPASLWAHEQEISTLCNTSKQLLQMPHSAYVAHILMAPQITRRWTYKNLILFVPVHWWIKSFRRWCFGNGENVTAEGGLRLDAKWSICMLMRCIGFDSIAGSEAWKGNNLEWAAQPSISTQRF